jgi:hypothetical protein
LNSINLLVYYTNFIESGFTSLEKVIENIDELNKPNFEDIESLGIKKPGHIYKILTRLELDSKLIDERYYFLIFEGRIPSSSYLRFSREKFTCCTGMDKNIDSDFKKIDLNIWLKKLNLTHLKKNFIHNGFDSIQYIILQMFSFNPLTDQMVEESLHIYDKKERTTILEQLAKDINLLKIKLSRCIVNDSIYEGETEESCKICSIF